ncbi:hypothetical protein D3C78_859010 [compost metagenome]
MLDAQPQLGQHAVGQIARRLGDKEHPHALGANQPNHLFQAILQGFRGAIEQ